MTTEAGISGTNITTISGNESKTGASKSQPTTSQNVQKRTVSITPGNKSDEIEVQVSDPNNASPAALNKVKI